MTFDQEPDQNPQSDPILDWLGDAASFSMPPFLDPYGSGDIDNDINSCQWWDPVQYLDQDFLNDSITSVNSTNNDIEATTFAISTTSPATSNPTPPPQRDLVKKRKVSDDPVVKTSENGKKKNTRRVNEVEDGDPGVEQFVTTRKTSGNKKNGSNNSSNGNTKEGRWAEQLLNPCAVAITSGNLTRVQHHLYVLHELASSSGDVNYRLVHHGLRALTHHLSSLSNTATATTTSSENTFAATEPRFFQRSLIQFYEVSPWFAFPNNIANTSIMQFLSDKQEKAQNLHILDIGVSHGVQWPTLLEALSRQSGGPPPLVRLTIIAPANEADQNSGPTFSIGPQGDNFSSRLLNYAKSININLQINRVDTHPLHSLNSRIIDSKPNETLIVSAQFRLHYLNHTNPDQRTGFLTSLRSLNPARVFLSENNIECSCNTCGDFPTGFSRRVEQLWKFLDSTSSAFKGRESEERRVMEGEASKALTNPGEMNEGKEKWCDRMRKSGFIAEVFGEDAIDGGRALLKKYDSNWEMKVEEKDGCVGLWWKGQPVSFCSLWKMGGKEHSI